MYFSITTSYLGILFINYGKHRVQLINHFKTCGSFSIFIHDYTIFTMYCSQFVCVVSYNGSGFVHFSKRDFIIMTVQIEINGGVLNLIGTPITNKST